MKKYIFLVCLAVWSAVTAISGVSSVSSVSAATYSPRTVPNPKDKGSGLFVSNPDTILSADDEAYLNRCCQMLKDSTDVELAIVVLESIGEYEPFDFGFELFQRWGIGQAGKNTGVLITFALASRQVYINTGTGIEGVLTDATCKTIIESDMIPRFKEGDYGGGLCAGATHIYTICTHGDAPEELMNMVSATNRGKFGSASRSGSGDDEIGILGWIVFTFIVFLFVLPFLLLVLIQRKTQSTADEMAQRDGCLNSLIIGCIVFPFLIPSAVWFWWRSKRVRCPKCGKQRFKIVEKKKTPQGDDKTLVTTTFLCSACGHTETESKVVTHFVSSGGSSGDYFDDSSYDSDDSYSSSSDSGSWGGGSSSGGGAGGSW